MSVKHNVGAATLLIHMLAKHDTPITESNTTLGLVPAKLNTRVMSSRSMLVLLRADAIVNPPIKSMIVGENMTEKMYLKNHEHPGSSKFEKKIHFVAALVLNRSCFPSEDRIVRNRARRKGTIIEVTNSGIACKFGPISDGAHPLKCATELTSVAHKIVAKVKIAKQLLASTASRTFTLSNVTNTARPIVRKKIRFVMRKVPQRVWMRKRPRLRSLTAGMPTPLIPPSPISPRRSCPIICRQTVSRSQTTYQHRSVS